MASASDTVGDGEYVSVFISSNVSSFTSQKRYASCTTIGDLKVSRVYSSLLAWIKQLKTLVGENKFLPPLCLRAISSCFQGKLELITGASAVSMHLQLFDSNQKLVRDLSDDLATLSSCGVENDMRIHVSLSHRKKFVSARAYACLCVFFFAHTQVTDSDPGRSKGEFEDLSKVEKYVMSDEDYAKRSGNGLSTNVDLFF